MLISRVLLFFVEFRYLPTWVLVPRTAGACNEMHIATTKTARHTPFGKCDSGPLLLTVWRLPLGKIRKFLKK